jgi:hypothetical protein
MEGLHAQSAACHRQRAILSIHARPCAKSSLDAPRRLAQPVEQIRVDPVSISRQLGEFRRECRPPPFDSDAPRTTPPKPSSKSALCKWWRSLAPALLAVALAITVAALRPTTEHADAKGRPPLWFGPGGVFKVALFADLHYGEDAWTDWGPAQDAASDRVMAAVLDAENPGACLRTLSFCFPGPFPFSSERIKELKRNSLSASWSLRRRNPIHASSLRLGGVRAAIDVQTSLLEEDPNKNYQEDKR